MHALSTAFTGNAVQTERLLSKLLEKFPESDAAPLAKSIVEGLLQGKMLAEKRHPEQSGGDCFHPVSVTQS